MMNPGSRNIVPSYSGWSGPSLGILLLKFLFPPIYALTVMPFTVQFFRRFILPPSTDATLFGLVPLAQVHEFLLPLFLLSLELISIQLAVAFWSDRSLWRKALVLLVFAGFQSFPYFSVFYDARITDLGQRTQKQPAVVTPEQQQAYDQQVNQLRQQYADQVAQYKLILDQNNNQQAARENDKKQLQQQIGSLNAAIDKARQDKASALQHSRNPVTIAEREAAAKDVASIDQQIAQYQNQLDAVQKSLNALTTAAPSPAPSAPAQPQLPPPPTPKPLPLPFSSDIDFIVQTLTIPASIIEMLVALIFPIIVFGAGYAIAASSTGPSPLAAGLTDLRIDGEIRLGEHLREDQQLIFAESLKPVIVSRVAMMRSEATNIVATSSMMLETSHEIDVLNWASSVAAVIAKSRLSEEAKFVLTECLQETVNPATSSL